MATPRFDGVIAGIDASYTLRKQGIWFRVGKHTNAEGNSSNGSLKIVAKTVLDGGTIGDALAAFGEYYDRVQNGEEGHKNIDALIALAADCGLNAKLAPHVEFENDQQPLRAL